MTEWPVHWNATLLPWAFHLCKSTVRLVRIDREEEEDHVLFWIGHLAWRSASVPKTHDASSNSVLSHPSAAGYCSDNLRGGLCFDADDAGLDDGQYNIHMRSVRDINSPRIGSGRNTGSVAIASAALPRTMIGSASGPILLSSNRAGATVGK